MWCTPRRKSAQHNSGDTGRGGAARERPASTAGAGAAAKDNEDEDVGMEEA